MTHRAALEHALRAVNVRLRELGDPVAADPHGDAVDRLTAREEHEHQVLGYAGLVERKRLILAALDRLDRGWDGRCLACGTQIKAKRFAAMPWTDRCTLCAAREEQIAARNALRPPDDIPALDDNGQA